MFDWFRGKLFPRVERKETPAVPRPILPFAPPQVTEAPRAVLPFPAEAVAPLPEEPPAVPLARRVVRAAALMRLEGGQCGEGEGI